VFWKNNNMASESERDEKVSIVDWLACIGQLNIASTLDTFLFSLSPRPTDDDRSIDGVSEFSTIENNNKKVHMCVVMWMIADFGR
jgi:hypothetical protein